ncbi:NADase-type glycan-binding domain-containing protein [Micromonospora cathayae]|uniref:F5/8 type C domain-containing protein n=1 Tax=Micromonospora cathayae TaxID=3028804 RepID=A0ABY7ZY59_9ACTN|nr:hypothetical protein [Micromonospora sp. HUAS 3]WDZ87027.1 hypothetical protein PVK37_11800 [Micromonospora sp. HUAS 3]
MIVCRECGNHNGDADTFCGSCGSFLEWTGEKTTPKITVEDVPEPEPEIRQKPTLLQRIAGVIAPPPGGSAVDDGVVRASDGTARGPVARPGLGGLSGPAAPGPTGPRLGATGGGPLSPPGTRPGPPGLRPGPPGTGRPVPPGLGKTTPPEGGRPVPPGVGKTAPPGTERAAPLRLGKAVPPGTRPGPRSTPPGVPGGGVPRPAGPPGARSLPPGLTGTRPVADTGPTGARPGAGGGPTGQARPGAGSASGPVRRLPPPPPGVANARLPGAAERPPGLRLGSSTPVAGTATGPGIGSSTPIAGTATGPGPTAADLMAADPAVADAVDADPAVTDPAVANHVDVDAGDADPGRADPDGAVTGSAARPEEAGPRAADVLPAAPPRRRVLAAPHTSALVATTTGSTGPSASGSTGSSGGAARTTAGRRPGPAGTGGAAEVEPEEVTPQPVRPRTGVPGRRAPTRRLQPGDLICGGCGEGNPPTRRFCSRCGDSLTTAEVVRRRWWQRLLPRRGPKVTEAGVRPGTPGGGSGGGPGGVLVGLYQRVNGVVAVLLFALGIAYLIYPPLRERVNSVVLPPVKDARAWVDRKLNPRFVAVRPVEVTGSASVGDHGPGLTVDQYRNTHWQARWDAERPPTVTLRFGAEVDLQRLIVIAGTAEKYTESHRPAKLHLVWSNNRSDTLTVQDTGEPQTLTLSAAEGVTSVQIQVTDVFRAATGTDVTVSEFEFFARE